MFFRAIVNQLGDLQRVDVVHDSAFTSSDQHSRLAAPISTRCSRPATSFSSSFRAALDAARSNPSDTRAADLIAMLGNLVLFFEEGGSDSDVMASAVDALFGE